VPVPLQGLLPCPLAHPLLLQAPHLKQLLPGPGLGLGPPRMFPSRPQCWARQCLGRCLRPFPASGRQERLGTLLQLLVLQLGLALLQDQAQDLQVGTMR
jgi:hypothetical protein